MCVCGFFLRVFHWAQAAPARSKDSPWLGAFTRCFDCDFQVDNKLLRLGINRTEEIRQDLISASQLLVQLLVSA